MLYELHLSPRFCPVWSNPLRPHTYRYDCMPLNIVRIPSCWLRVSVVSCLILRVLFLCLHFLHMFFSPALICLTCGFPVCVYKNIPCAPFCGSQILNLLFLHFSIFLSVWTLCYICSDLLEFDPYPPSVFRFPAPQAWHQFTKKYDPQVYLGDTFSYSLLWVLLGAHGPQALHCQLMLGAGRP